MKKLALPLAVLTIAQWSFLAYLGSKLKHLPPFLLVGIALCAGALIGITRVREWRVPWKTFAVGVYGIFGYHFLLFTAFQFAPAVEANLLNYLWPLLIVLLSPIILQGFRLKIHHMLGALLGLAGAVLIVSGGKFHLDIQNLPGYLMAAGAAFVWSSYSLMTKRLPQFSTAAVAGFCLGSGLLSLVVFFLTGGTIGAILALTGVDWLYLGLIGIFPMGLAFYTWDAALKRGDPRIIGSLAYITPLTSTLALVLLGGQKFSWLSLLAMGLILSGAMVGSIELFRKPQAGQGSP